MELRHLRYFIAVAEELHFGRAAERLGIAQPPLSRQIQYLEQYLKADLLIRTSRHVDLTPAGRMFLIEAYETLRAAEHARQVARRADRGEVGELSVGLFPSAPLINGISAMLRDYRQNFPNVHLSLQEYAFVEGIKALRAGSLDICFVRSDIRPALPAGFEIINVLEENMAVLLYEDHPLAQSADPLDLSALAEEPMIHFAPNNALLAQVLRICRNAGFEPHIEQEAGQNSTIVGLVAAGMGISILPPSICQIGQRGTLVRSLRGGQDLRSSAWLIYKADSRLAVAFSEVASRHRVAA